MIVVSGCPRSGTSMMMRIMESVFGEDRIIGRVKKDPEKKKKKEFSEIQKYLRKQDRRNQKNKEQAKRAKDMNPNGYYEMRFCVEGIYFRPYLEDLLEEIEDASRQSEPRICKVVAQGLAHSDPRFIDKIVYMARDPRAVAKSQERLGRNNPMTPEDAPERDGKKVLIRSAQMFNQVTTMAANWIERHPEIPVHIVNYDRLLDNPDAELRPLQEFLGEGDFTSASALIDPTLRRSAPEDLEGEAGQRASKIYARLLVKGWKEIMDNHKARVEEFQKNPPPPTNWDCPRLGQSVNVEMCKLCKTHDITAANLRKNAERRKIDWRNEPCPYECGIEEGIGISIAESILNNHWHAATQ